MLLSCINTDSEHTGRIGHMQQYAKGVSVGNHDNRVIVAAQNHHARCRHHRGGNTVLVGSLSQFFFLKSVGNDQMAPGPRCEQKPFINRELMSSQLLAPAHGIDFVLLLVDIDGARMLFGIYRPEERLLIARENQAEALRRKKGFDRAQLLESVQAESAQA